MNKQHLDHEAWFNQGNTLFSQGRYEEAIASYDKAVEIKPNKHEAWYIHGIALFYLGRYGEAIASFDKTVEIKPNKHEAWYNRGIVLGSLGRYEEAVNSFDKAVGIKPDYHDAWNNRGLPLDNLGRYEEALASYDKALEIKPDSHQAWYNCGIVLGSLGRYEEALASYDKALEIKPDSHQVWYNRGIVLGSLGRYEEALTSYDKALEIKPNKHEAWHNRGNVLNSLGKYKEALASIDRALEIKPDDHNTWYSHARVLDSLGRYGEEIASFNKAIAIKPDLHDAWIGRDRTLIKLDRVAEVTASIKRYAEIEDLLSSMEITADSADNLSNLGLFYQNLAKAGVESGTYEQKAIHSYNLALSFYKPQLQSFDCLITGTRLGNLAFKIGNLKLAIEGYAKAIEGVEQLRSWAPDENRREEIQAQAIESYSNIIQSYVNLNQYEEAMEYVERSRSRRLVELMHTKDLYRNAEIPQKVKPLLEALDAKQREINATLPFLQGDGRTLAGTRDLQRSRALTEAITEKAKKLEDEYQQIWLQLNKVDKVFASQQKVDALKFSDMQALLAGKPTTAILNFYSTRTDTHIFILRHTDQGVIATIHSCGGQGVKNLHGWLFTTWVQPYLDDKTTWAKQMPVLLAELSQRLELDNLIHTHLGNITELILIPHLYLHQIPFAALPISNDQGTSYLGDRFKLRYIPNTQILKFCQDRDQIEFNSIKDSLGTVENTRGDLPFSSFEGSTIATMFKVSDTKRLQDKQATDKEYIRILQQVNGLLSSHHAYSRFDNPLQSMLVLGNGTTITLGQLLLLRFLNLHEVVLSCCETGLGLVKTLTDDIVTIGTGFLCAGARAVISSLWTVDDLATSIFSIFYYEERVKGSDRPTAIQNAQKHLRELTGKELHKYNNQLHPYQAEVIRQRREQFKEAKDETEKNEAWKRLNKAEKLLNTLYKSAHPFSSEFYWSAFKCEGLA